jgi:glycerophosphoryl diester phosphodiesterase
MSRCPENTWQGLEAALGAGACWLEFDVQLCADDRFVLLHDADLQRTTGQPGSVFALGLEELRHYSAHEPQRFGERFKPAGIASLETVLERLTRYPKARVMVEIKTESLQQRGVEPVMERLLATLEPFRAQCVVISFSHEAIACARQAGRIDTGWVLHRYDDAHRARADSLQPEFLICNQSKIPQRQAPWPGPWQWMLYDIVDPQQALDWHRRGVSLIETADIGGLLQHPLLAPGACRHGL